MISSDSRDAESTQLRMLLRMRKRGQRFERFERLEQQLLGSQQTLGSQAQAQTLSKRVASVCACGKRACVHTTPHHTNICSQVVVSCVAPKAIGVFEKGLQ